MRAKIILIMFVFNCFAQARLTPEEIKTVGFYKHKKELFRKCLNGQSTSSAPSGCVETIDYFQKFCEDKKSNLFRKASQAKQNFSDSCDLVALAETKLQKLFEVDEKMCRPGFRSSSEQLISLARIKDYFLETDVYMFEKNSCKDMQKYVNLCRYIDGDMKELVPKNQGQLPDIFLQSKDSVCVMDGFDVDSLALLKRELASVAKNPSLNAHHLVVMKFRSRQFLSATTIDPSCEGLRNIYKNLSCQKFESLNEGEPIYFSTDEMRARRIQRQSGSSTAK